MRSKTKKKGRKRPNEVDSDDENGEANEVFAQNEDLKKLIDNLVQQLSKT